MSGHLMDQGKFAYSREVGLVIKAGLSVWYCPAKIGYSGVVEAFQKNL